MESEAHTRLRARPLTQDEDAGDHTFRVQELATAMESETQMHQGANMGHVLCTLCPCHAVD